MRSVPQRVLCTFNASLLVCPHARGAHTSRLLMRHSAACRSSHDGVVMDQKL